MIERYTEDGHKDINGKVSLRYSLQAIMMNCQDFKEEETALQHLVWQLGLLLVLFTPKFHAELAGEGVEYSWAHAEAFYRQHPVSRKGGQESFKQLARDCTCPANVLTKFRKEKFASQARVHICTYHCIEEKKKKAGDVADTILEEHATLAEVPVLPANVVPNPKHQELLNTPEIERVMKAFKGTDVPWTLTGGSSIPN